MTISTKSKESTKTALAMTLAYGIALPMDWERPYWAGFAVALGELNPQDSENFYRLLGAYRGALKALIEYTESAGDSDWARWREERFA